MSSPAAVSKKIEQIESQLGKLKLMLTAKSAGKSKSVSERAQRKRKDKPESIESCKKKAELEKFTVAELKEWVKKNGVDVKKLAKKHKEDYVKLVWKNLKSSANESSSDESSSDSSSSSGSDSGSSSSDSE
jgi:hypothetical protein